MRFRFVVPCSLVAAIVFACGGRVTTPGDSGDAAGADEAGPEGSVAVDGGVTNPTFDGSGPCVKSPIHGTPCIPGQVSCDRVDLCCATAMVCDAASNTWNPTGEDCLLCPTHPCGDQTCQGTEMCITHPQSGGPATYECAQYPGACAREWTCLCVEGALPSACKGPAQGCADDKLPVTLVCD